MTNQLPAFLPEGQHPTVWHMDDGAIWRHATKREWDNAGEKSREIFTMKTGGICFAVRGAA